MRNMRIHGLHAVVTLVLVVTAAPAQISVLYNFGSKAGDPLQPSYSGIVAQGRDGNLYSTSVSGGTGTGGTVFRIAPNGRLKVLYSFDSTHGATPYGGLTLGSDGRFYGTATTAGQGCCGTIFKITPNGTLTVIHNFTGGADGGAPQAPPIQGRDGKFYGTTNGGRSAIRHDLQGHTFRPVQDALYIRCYTRRIPNRSADSGQGRQLLRDDDQWRFRQQFWRSIQDVPCRQSESTFPL